MTAGIQPDSYVWRQGLADWVKADTLPELADIFMGDSAFGGYARPEESLDPYASRAHRMPQPPYGGNGFGNTPPDPVLFSHLTLPPNREGGVTAGAGVFTIENTY